MKKLFFPLMVGFVFFALFACSNGKKVQQIVFTDQVKQAVLVVLPGYEERTLKVSYTYYLDEEGEDISEGILGGDFFDRFEQSLKIIDLMPISDGNADFMVSYNYEGEAGKSGAVVVRNFNSGDKNIQILADFYTDVVSLLTENSPV